MTESQIVNGWCDNVFRERQQNRVFPNVFIGLFEADILEVTKSGYSYEYEVKLTKDDFKHDKDKVRETWKTGKVVKYDQLKNGERVNYFSYVVPDGLIKPKDIPEWAGLVYVKESEYVLSDEHGRYTKPFLRCVIVKAPSKLCKDKFPSERILKCYESMYFRYHAKREKPEKKYI